MEPLYIRWHDKSDHHRKQLEGSYRAGCFFCLKVFRPFNIKEWIDDDSTALCPYCGIDSVVPMDGVDLQLLQKMNQYWFKETR